MKKKIRSFFSSAILLILLINVFNVNAQKVYKVAAFNYYPAIFLDKDGAVKGFYVDALNEISQKENIKFEYVYGSWSQGLERIKTNEVDLLTSVAFTPERAVYMDYSSVPLMTVWGELYVGVQSEIDGITQIEGKKVAVMKSDYNALAFINLIKNFGISCDFVEVSGFEEVFNAVSNKDVDAGVVNNSFGSAKQKYYKLRSTGVVFNPFDIFFTTAKGKNSDLLELLSKYLHNWKHQQNSVYNIARKKWTHGSVGIIEIFPKWLITTIVILAILVIISLLFIVILRIQVRKATNKVIQRENRLIESEKKFRSFIDNSPEGIFLVDENGKYLEVNDASCNISGYSKEEFSKMTIFDLMLTENIDKDLKYFHNLITEGQVNFEIKGKRKDGSKRWWSIVGVKLSESKYLGFTRDVTERKLVENELVKLSSAVKQSPVSILITDLDGNIQYVNPRACELTGYSYEELFGKNPRIFKSGDLSPEIYKNLWETIKDGREWRGEFHNVKKNGDFFWEEAAISPVLNTDGEISNYLAIKTDISERKRFIAQLEKEIERAEASDRLKTAFINNISHEIRTPLNGILGFSELISNPDITEDERKDFLKMISKSSNRLINTITSYMDISMIVSGNQTVKMTEFNIKQFVIEIYNANIEKSKESNIDFILEEDEKQTIETIITDKNLLEKILNHLLDNSFKFTEKGRVVITYKLFDNKIKFEISDTGKGIESEKFNHIFNYFEQGDPNDTRGYEGSGLGLSISKGLVSLLNGSISLYSSQNSGSTFKVIIPIK